MCGLNRQSACAYSIHVQVPIFTYIIWLEDIFHLQHVDGVFVIVEEGST